MYDENYPLDNRIYHAFKGWKHICYTHLFMYIIYVYKQILYQLITYNLLLYFCKYHLLCTVVQN